MAHQIGVEDIEPDHWVAWSFERIGYTGSGSTQQEAIENLKRQFPLSNLEVAEVFRAYPSSEDRPGISR